MSVAIGWARSRLELLQFFRQRDSVVFIYAFPIVLLFIFGSVFDEDMGDGVSFAQYFTAGMIASGIMATSFQSLAIQIALERDDGTLKRIVGTPMPRSSYFIGKVGLVVVTGVSQALVLIFVGALLFDLDLPSTASRWWTFAWVAVLGATSCTLLGIVCSNLPRSGRSAAAVITPIVIVLQFISGVFFVFSELPTWMQQLASLFPLKWMTQGMRSVFLPDSFSAEEAAGSWELERVAAVLVVWTVVGAVLAVRTFRWTRPDAG